MKTCLKCKKIKSVDDFNFKNKSKGLRHSQCKLCTRFSVKNHYNKNREYYLKKAQKRNVELRLKINNYIKDYLLKNPCVDCGETDLVVLEFDHNKEDFVKLKAISSLVRERNSLEIIKEEIKKCEVRCANCHRRKTAKAFNWFKR